MTLPAALGAAGIPVQTGNATVILPAIATTLPASVTGGAPAASLAANSIAAVALAATPNPEPTTWTMLIAGSALLGGGGLFRRRKARS